MSTVEAEPSARSPDERIDDGAGETAELESLLIFRLGSSSFAFASLNIDQITNVEQAVRLPHAPPHIPSVVYTGGRVLAQVALAELLGVQQGELSNAARTIIVEIDGIHFCFYADSVRGVRSVAASEILKVDQDSAKRDRIRGRFRDGQETVCVLAGRSILNTLLGKSAHSPEAPEG